MAMGRYWCAERFVCSQCGVKLSGGEGGFHYEDGLLFCPKCFTLNNAVECFGCKQLVGGNDLWIEAMDQNWHPQCFVCVVSILNSAKKSAVLCCYHLQACRKSLDGGSFFVKAGSPYCSKCK